MGNFGPRFVLSQNAAIIGTEVLVSKPMKIDRSAASYFLFQGLCTGIWWGVLFIEPSYRRYFALESASDTSLLAFSVADISFWGIGSVIASWLCFIESEYRQIAAWFVTGAVAYAAICCATYAWLTDHGWLGVVLMFPAMIWSGTFSVGISFRKTMFRQAAMFGARWNMAKTLAQIVVIWSVILAVIPYMITIVEGKVGVTALSFNFQKEIAIAVFLLSSSVGLWSAFVMSRSGRGTPLPLDHASDLVITGPYSYIRNPMALSGICQGLSVAVFFGSPLVAAYAVMGSLIWQTILRPIEEADLVARFGQRFEDYRDSVRCWIPRVHPYQSEISIDSSNSADRPSGSM